MKALKLVPALLLFVLSAVLVTAAPTLIDELGMNVTVDSVETTLAGNVTDGYKITLDHNSQTEYHLQFNVSPIASEPLNQSAMFGLYVTSTKLEAYYSDAPEQYKEHLINISRGIEPFAYINGTNSQLVDARILDIIYGEQRDLQIFGDFPTGEYVLSGRIQNDTGSWSDVSIKLLVNLDKTLDLVAGWNQVSSPFTESLSVSVLQSQCPGVRIVKGFTSTSESFDDVTSLEAGKGYRIYSDSACSVSYDHTYSAYEAFDQTLGVGTHLIGAPYSGMAASEFHDKCNVNGDITGWDANGNEIIASTLEAGKGYFITLNAACDITETEKVNISIDSYNPISVIQDQAERTNFTLRNIGNRHVDNIRISVSDLMNTKGDIITKEHIFLDKIATSIKIAENETIGMTYLIDATQPAGVYAGFVTISYEGKTAVQEVSVTVVAIDKKVGTSYTPVSVIQEYKANTTLTLTNNGNVELDEVSVSFNSVRLNSTEEILPVLNATRIAPFQASESADIGIEYYATGKAAGTYEVNITITYGDVTEKVPVTLTVTARNENINVVYNEVQVTQGNNATTTFSITNVGNVPINAAYVVSNLVNSAGEVIVPAVNDTSTTLDVGRSETVEVNYTTTRTQSGTYNGNITTTFDGQEVVTPIRLIVNEIQGSVTIEYVSVSGMQGDTVETNFTITNNGDKDLTIDLELANLTKGNDEIVSPIVNDITLAIGASSRTDLTFTIPETLSAGTYSGNLVAKFQDQTITQPITITVIAKQKTISYPTSTSLRWLNGLNQGVSAQATIQNTGNVDLDISLSMSNLVGNGIVEADKVILSETLFTLTPGESKNVVLTPTGINALGGSYVGSLDISYNGQTTQMPVSLTVKDPEYSMDASDVTFDGNIRGKNVSKTITINNNGDYDLGMLTITHTIANKYNTTITPTAFSGLAIGASQNIVLTIEVPEDESTQNHKIGEIKIVEANVNKTLNVYLNPDSVLRIEELEIEVDGDSDEVENGDTVSDEAKPGSEVKFEFKLENLLEYSELRDVIIEIEIEDIDEGDDLELESDETDIDEEDDERIELEFTVPMLVDDKEYDIYIHIEGEDEDGNVHEIDWVVKLQVEKEKHELVLDRVVMSPTRVTCSRSSTLEVKVINIGEKDEDDIEVIVRNDELNFESKKTFDLDSGDDDDAERTTSFSIRAPEVSRTKTYTFNVDVYRNGRRDDSETVDLTVEKCDIVVDDEDEEEEEGPFVVKGGADVVPPPQQEESSALDDLRESDLYLPALGVIALAAGVAVFAMIPK